MPYIFYLNTHSCKYACGCNVCGLRLIKQVIEVWSKFCFVSPVKFVKSHLHPSGSKTSTCVLFKKVLQQTGVEVLWSTSKAWCRMMGHACKEDSVKVFFSFSSMWQTGCATLNALILEIQNEDNVQQIPSTSVSRATINVQRGKKVGQYTCIPGKPKSIPHAFSDSAQC